jgi:hypothetical protein
MRRVLLSILIAVGLLAVPLVYVPVLPSTPLCPDGWWCEPTSVKSGVRLFFLPGLLLTLPFLFFTDNGYLQALVAVGGNIAVYATVVWLLLSRRARRLEGPRKTTLPL